MGAYVPKDRAASYEKLYCNCAGCKRELLSKKNLYQALPGEIMVHDRIGGRPYCSTCAWKIMRAAIPNLDQPMGHPDVI